MRRVIILSILILVCQYLKVSGRIIHIPGDYPTIQLGINESERGDTVLVHPGTYYENVVSNGSNVAIGSLFLTTGDTSYISTTIIDGGGTGTVFTSSHDLQGPPIFAGFTVQNGHAYSGGGIYLSTTVIEVHSNIIRNNGCEYNGGGIYGEGYYMANIHDNIIIDNQAGYRGGGIYFIDSGPLLRNNRISGNSSGGNGGGVYYWSCTAPDMTGDYISGNQAEGDGGGIYMQHTSHIYVNRCVVADNICAGYGGGIAVRNSDPHLVNVTVSRNAAATGGGTFCDQPTTLRVVNSIFWGDSASVQGNEIELEGNAFIVNYSDIEGGFSGNGNINEDPLFADPENGVFYLQDGSPCIDAGDPDWPRDPDGSIVEMGAFYHGIVIPEIIDQEQMIADSGFWFDEGMVRWQQFFPELNNISAVSVYIVKAGSPGSAIVRITDDSGESLAEASIDGDDIDGNNWNRFDLPMTVDLNPGEPYRIYLLSSRPSPSPNERYTWSGNHDSDYPGITDVYNDEPSFDYAFMTYGYDRRTGEEDIDIAVLPDGLCLLGNYPNPFNAATIIEYELPSASNVTIEIYDVLGRRVKSLIQGWLQPGLHRAVWDGSGGSSGIYFCTIRSGNFIDSKKMLLLK